MKATSMAKQYLRTSLKNKIDFFLFAVQAKDYDLFTAESWESELFRQIQLFIDQLIQEKRIDEEYSQPGSQPNLSDEMEAVLQQLQNDEDEDYGPLEGKRYTFHINPRKCEVRVAKDKNGQSLLKDYLRIMNNLCKMEEPNFPEFLKYRNENHEEEDNGDMDDDQSSGEIFIIIIISIIIIIIIITIIIIIIIILFQVEKMVIVILSVRVRDLTPTP